MCAQPHYVLCSCVIFYFCGESLKTHIESIIPLLIRERLILALTTNSVCIVGKWGSLDAH